MWKPPIPITINTSYKSHLRFKLTLWLPKLCPNLPSSYFYSTYKQLILQSEFILQIVNCIHSRIIPWFLSPLLTWASEGLSGRSLRTRLTCCGAGIAVTFVVGSHHTYRSLTIDFYDASPPSVIKDYWVIKFHYRNNNWLA